MKFFKHFVGAHRGNSLKAIRRNLGMAGVGMYWSLVELCAEKMNKNSDEEFCDKHCHFEFDISSLSECLGVKSGRVEVILNSFQEQDQLQFERVDFIFKIYMPKLLECLDRDVSRARTVREKSALKNKNKNKNKIFNETPELADQWDWILEAETCLQAARLHCSDEIALLFLGDARRPYVEYLGGMKFFRNLQHNNFEVKRLASLIKNAWISIRSENQAGA